MSHGNAVPDIALVFNQAQDGLYGSGSKDQEQGAMSHGNAVSDIALVFNQAREGLYGSGSKDHTSFDLFSAINSVREPFIKFCKAHEKRLRLCVPFQRVNLARPRDEDPTLVCISCWTRLLCSGL
jgi:hypothetical protein